MIFLQTKFKGFIILLGLTLFSVQLIAQTPLFIDKQGQVGIGTETPESKLHVSGDLRISGSVNAEGGMIDLGFGKDREGNAGKISYGRFDEISLCIVGAGKTGGSRRITFWNEGGARFIGRVQIDTIAPPAPLVVNQRIKDQTGYVTPVGGIIMYSGDSGNFDRSGAGILNSPVQGWALCDGQNGRPDLRSRFITGASANGTSAPGNLTAYGVNQTGGEEKHQLTVAELASHTHVVSLEGRYKMENGSDHDVMKTDERIDDRRSTKSAGGNQPHENRPPYYALFYIMKL